MLCKGAGCGPGAGNGRIPLAGVDCAGAEARRVSETREAGNVRAAVEPETSLAL